jgi:putative iron-regulated protein
VWCLCLAFAAACSPDSPAPDLHAEVVRQYVALMRANGSEVVDKLEALDGAVGELVDGPSEAALSRAREAWLDARPAYGQLEVGRFYNGPVDVVNGVANEWPVDEKFIDYTADDPNSGIINRISDFPDITPEVLIANDEVGGIENLSTGYHAIEFLLWGQRLQQSDGPGDRPYTDYVDGGTAQNQERRRTYLKAATEVLLFDLTGVLDAWDPDDPDSYGARMIATPPLVSLADLVRGMTSMAISELFYERMTDPYLTQNRKDEESCFSESTQLDLAANMLGVENVYLGRYGSVKGASISDLVRASKPELDATLRKQLKTTREAIDAIPPPFDHAVIAPEGSAPREAVKAALDTFAPMVESLRQMADLLGIKTNI